ncbi:MAG TPA: hypothetical protein VIO33_06080, partial [Burkholderiaceae bacterium]
MRHAAIAWALMSATLFAMPAHASDTPTYWKNNCAGCHGSPVGLTPRFSTPLDSRVLTRRIDLSASGSWLSSRTDLANHINGVNGTMSALATLTPDPEDNTELGNILQYLVDARDAVMPTSVAGFGDTLIGGTDSTVTLQIQNSRFLALSFSVSRSGTDAADFSVSGCGLSGAGTGGSVPAAVLSSTAGIYNPSSCTLTLNFHPSAGATVIRDATLSVTFSGNESGDPPARTGIALQGFARPPLEITVPANGIATFTTSAPNTTANSTVTIKDRVGSSIQICRRSVLPLDGKTHYTLDAPYTLSGDCATVPAASTLPTASSPRTLNVGVTFSPGTVTTPLNAKLEVGPD